jgi:hypothetical protein
MSFLKNTNYRDEFGTEAYEVIEIEDVQEAFCIRCNLMFDNQEDYDNHMRKAHKEMIAYEDEFNEDDSV